MYGMKEATVAQATRNGSEIRRRAQQEADRQAELTKAREAQMKAEADAAALKAKIEADALKAKQGVAHASV